jgi:phage shock protein PspC (stress-responsive transcriptional regulator)
MAKRRKAKARPPVRRKDVKASAPKKAAVAAASQKKPVKKAKKENQFEQGIEDFSEEIERLGERFGQRMEEKGRHAGSFMHDTFGVVGPLLSSVCGLVCLAILMWVLALVNVPVGSGLLYNVQYFLLAHVAWFFLIFLFFSYSSYLSRKMGGHYMLISPLISAAGITVALWIAASAIRIANIPLGVDVFSSLSTFISQNLWLFFCLFSFLGYLITVVGFAFGKVKGMGCPQEKHEKHVARHPVPGRLYRSGKERILGGVCGGIAQHLGIDPVVVRLLWIAASLAWGFGIILYLICWIVIPRNPKDSWN